MGTCHLNILLRESAFAVNGKLGLVRNEFFSPMPMKPGTADEVKQIKAPTWKLELLLTNTSVRLAYADPIRIPTGNDLMILRNDSLNGESN